LLGGNPEAMRQRSEGQPWIKIEMSCNEQRVEALDKADFKLRDRFAESLCPGLTRRVRAGLWSSQVR